MRQQPKTPTPPRPANKVKKVNKENMDNPQNFGKLVTCSGPKKMHLSCSGLSSFSWWPTRDGGEAHTGGEKWLRITNGLEGLILKRKNNNYNFFGRNKDR